MYENFGLFIDGQWRQARSGRTIDVIDPATEEWLGAIPQAGAEDLDAALKAASGAAHGYKCSTPKAIGKNKNANSGSGATADDSARPTNIPQRPPVSP